MPVIGLPRKASKGLSFSVPELILIRSWSDANGLRMVVRLDHGSESEDYEEVLALHLGDSPQCHCIMWRGAKTVFVQPMAGHMRRFGSVAEAFEALTATQHVVVTDIAPACWPA
jgi:hypothetical protein